MNTETLGAKHTNKLFEKFAPQQQDTQLPHVPKMKVMKNTSKKTDAKVVTMACKKRK